MPETHGMVNWYSGQEIFAFIEENELFQTWKHLIRLLQKMVPYSSKVMNVIEVWDQWVPEIAAEAWKK